MAVLLRTPTFLSAAGICIIVALDYDRHVISSLKSCCGVLDTVEACGYVRRSANARMRLKENRKSEPSAAADGLLLGWWVCWEPLDRCCEVSIYSDG